jgi:peptide/nickel transport system substrate-binding protein
MKASDAFVWKLAVLATVVFLALFLIRLSVDHAVRVPAKGGTFSEGIIGTPRFANPVLAVTRADKDLSALVYDGLMMLGEDGTLTSNVAKGVTVSEDGLTYNVILRDDVKFHDGETLTSRDVAFTIGRIQDPLLASPLRANFDGVTTEEVGDYEINLIIPEPYAPFIENLTFGILPEHIWRDAGSDEFPFSQHNSEPVGTGPYVIDKIERNASGIPETYILKANTAYHIQVPKIETFELHFYPSEARLIEAFKKGTVSSVVGVDSARLPEYGLDGATHHIERTPLPRTFAVFFNQNRSAALRDSTARKALDVAVDREALVEVVLGGYGNPLTSPMPRGFGVDIEEPENMPEDELEAARAILREGGWEINTETQIWEKTIDKTKTPLSFSIATVNNSSFEASAEFLRKTWELLGAEVDVKQFEQSDLTQSVIRPRDYEALLFGTQLGRSLDFYSFWHSSQRIDPGLNIALYTNITTDSILAEMRRSTNPEGRSEAIKKFIEELKKETPAIFLYTPELLYIFPNKVTGASFTGVGEPHERFSRVHEWFIQTESVWPVFTE